MAARKVRGLLECGASVTVIAPSLSDDMEALTASLHAVERRPYRRGDVSAYRLVVTATGIPDVDGAAFADGEAAGVWVNSADDPANCSFILPAVHRDGDVTVSVSTGGLSPALASWLRDRLAAEYAEHLGTLAQLLGEGRASGSGEPATPTESVDWAALLDGPLLDLVRSGDVDAARALVADATRVSPCSTARDHRGGACRGAPGARRGVNTVSRVLTPHPGAMRPTIPPNSATRDTGI